MPPEETDNEEGEGELIALAQRSRELFEQPLKQNLIEP